MTSIEHNAIASFVTARGQSQSVALLPILLHGLSCALGFGTPALGLLANVADLGAAFAAAAVAALCAGPIAAAFLRTSARPAIVQATE